MGKTYNYFKNEENGSKKYYVKCLYDTPIGP